MANNQYVNKVEFGDTTIMDISDTTADAGDVIEGEVFYTKSGARSVGTLGDATQSTHGLMSTTDKTKLDGIDLSLYAPKAHPIFTGSISMGRKTGTNMGEGSVATGYQVSATAPYSHAEGSGTTASDASGHAEGIDTMASGISAHAEGYDTTASGYAAHAEGYSTTASGYVTHAEGSSTTANSSYAHAEGQSTTASGVRSHAEGYNTQALLVSSHAEGESTIAGGPYSHAEGFGGTYTSNGTTYTGGTLGAADHVEGYQTRTGSSGNPGNHAEGYQTAATGGSSHSEGAYTLSSGSASHSEGFTTTASGTNAHAEGAYTTASATNTHAEGTYTTASEGNAHAEGAGVVASGSASHAEGLGTIAAGSSSHAGGEYNIADSYDNFAEWEPNTEYSVGDQIKVTSTSNGTTTIKSYICKVNHTSGESFSSATNWESAYGKMAYAEIIGNGTSGSDRSNARALDWKGNEYLNGELYVECDSDSTNGRKVATELYVSTAISNIVLPTKVSDLNNDSGFLTSVPVMTGATSSAAGTAGLVPAPATTDVDKFLAGDGTYKSGGLPMVILSYGNSTWAQFEAAYKNNVIVYTRASSNSNPASGSQTRMAFMAYVNNATTPTEVEFQYYRSMSSHSATAMGDQVFVYKLNKTNGWSVITRDASIKEINVATGSKLGVSWSSNKVTLSNTMTANDMPMSPSDATTTKAAIEAVNDNVDNYNIVNTTNGRTNISTPTLINCSGTVSNNMCYHLSGNILMIEGRIRINNFVRTGSNPGYSFQLPSNKKLKRGVNINSGTTATSNQPYRLSEMLQIEGSDDGTTISVYTTETLSNMNSADNAFFIVYPVYIEVY